MKDMKQAVIDEFLAAPHTRGVEVDCDNCRGEGINLCTGEFEDGSGIDCAKECPIDREPLENAPCEVACPHCKGTRKRTITEMRVVKCSDCHEGLQCEIAPNCCGHDDCPDDEISRDCHDYCIDCPTCSGTGYRPVSRREWSNEVDWKGEVIDPVAGEFYVRGARAKAKPYLNGKPVEWKEVV